MQKSKWIFPSSLSFLALLISTCGTPYGIYHRVKPGENLYRIARTYQVDLQEIAELNNITEASLIRPGQKVFIPGANRQLPVVVPDPGPGGAERVTVSRDPGEKSPPAKQIVTEKGKFIWPVRGKVTSRFGMRKGKPHDGIDISAPEGTPVVAAAAGRVIYSSDKIRSYGNLVIIKHQGRYSTVYAHNQKNLVGEGDFVEKGQVIARVGDTGRASAPHLHFEVRFGKKPRNPEFFLP